MAIAPAPFGRGEIPNRAIADFNESLRLGPGNANDFNGRGLVYLDKRDYAHAIADFSEAIRLDPTFVSALSNRCWARALAGQQFDDALADCDKALSLRPDDPLLLERRALVYLKFGEPAKAIAGYDAALRLDPGQALALYGRGIAKARTGDTDGGRADMTAAASLRPDVADAFAKLGIR